MFCGALQIERSTSIIAFTSDQGGNPPCWCSFEWGELGSEFISRRGELIFACKRAKKMLLGVFFAFWGVFRVLGGVFALCGCLFRA